MIRQGRPRRAARVSVPNQERAIISVDGSNIIGILCKLSLTGGSVRLPKSFRAGSLGQITLKTARGKISAAIQFMNPGREAQGFRFIHMELGDRQQLDAAVQQMLKQGYGDNRSLVQPLVQLAQRALGAAKKAVS